MLLGEAKIKKCSQDSLRKLSSEQRLCELLQLKIILEDLKIIWEGLMKIYCDKFAVSVPHNLVLHDHTITY